MNKKRKIALVIGCILLFAVGLLVGRYWLPSCSTCPDCPDCPECPECPSCPLSPTLSIEKWVQEVDCNYGWQKEISAEKGDWIEIRVVVNITQTINNVWVRDASLASDPWTRVQDLRVDGVPFSGDITEGISLGMLTDESREITFRAQLSKSTYRYDCGVNILENLAEAGDCGFKAAASVKIIVDVYCAPPSGGGGGGKTKIEPPDVVTW